MRGASLMFQFILVENSTGTADGNGQPVYGAAVGTRAQVTEKRKILSTQDSTDIISTAQVALPPGITVQVQDRITLPSGTAMTVQAVETARGSFGHIWHKVAYL